MSKRLSNADVISLAATAARRLAITFPPREQLLKAMEKQIPMPTVLKSDQCRLWVDKYYIAFAWDEETDIRYIYLTEEHIREEYGSYAQARKSRQNQVFLPADIKKAFRRATSSMNRTGKGYWLDREFFERV
jgi:hypothetical protein